MTIKFYASPISTCSKRVAVVLKETNTPYEFISIDIMKGEQKAPDFVAKQPFGQVPYIDDDGFILYESRAISRYIAAKAGSSLLPTGDAKKVGLFEQAVSIETSNFDPHASGITVQRVFTPMMGGKPDEERVKGYSTTLEKNLATYNQILSKQKYLAGNELTLADLFHLSYGVFLAPQQFTWLEDEAKYPHLARWWKEISSRPSWTSVKDGITG